MYTCYLTVNIIIAIAVASLFFFSSSSSKPSILNAKKE